MKIRPFVATAEFGVDASITLLIWLNENVEFEE